MNSLRYKKDEVILEIKHRKLYLIFANFLLITGIVSIIFLSTFIVTYSTGLFSGLYVSEILSSSIRDPYTYDAVIPFKNPESLEYLNEDVKIYNYINEK